MFAAAQYFGVDTVSPVGPLSIVVGQIFLGVRGVFVGCPGTASSFYTRSVGAATTLTELQ